MSTDPQLVEESRYRWWTVFVFRCGVKLGPVTMFGYRWFDGRVRISMCAFGHAEHILWGGPLA